VRSVPQPGIISKACGIHYSVFVEPKNVTLKDDPFQVGAADNTVETWLEHVIPDSARVLAWYDHPHWGQYAAVTQNDYGQGWAMYVGFLPGAALMQKILARAAQDAGVWGVEQQLAFPLITRSGTNTAGKAVHYTFNYAATPVSFKHAYPAGTELISGAAVAMGQEVTLEPWGFAVIEEG
jgi:beta-galactosidase